MKEWEDGRRRDAVAGAGSAMARTAAEAECCCGARRKEVRRLSRAARTRSARELKKPELVEPRRGLVVSDGEAEVERSASCCGETNVLGDIPLLTEAGQLAEDAASAAAAGVEAACDLAVAAVHQVVAAAHVPEWARRPFITHGYRPIGASMRDIALSAFGVHNETVNFWTHFIPSVLFGLVALPYAVGIHLAQESFADRAFMAAYVIAAAACHSASSAYHLFACRSERAFSRLCRIDYKGIVSLICASQLPALNVIIARKDGVLGAISLIALVVIWAVGMPLMSILERRALDGLKNMLMIAMAVYGTLWALALRALDAAAYYAPGEWSFYASRTLPMYGLYTLGFIVFGLRVPERWIPGRFDLIGHSHQIWHVAVTAACVMWLIALLQFHDFAAAQKMAAAAAKAALDASPSAAQAAAAASVSAASAVSVVAASISEL